MSSNTLARQVTVPQGIYEESDVQKAPLGMTMDLNDGRRFQYCEAGGTGLVVARLLQSEAVVGNHGGTGQALDAPAAGTNVINVTPGASAGSANDYAEGYIVIVNDTGDVTIAGTVYKVSGHAAITASTAFDVRTLDDLWEAIGANSTGALVKHPCKDVIVKPASPATAPLVGVPIRDITADYFFWSQIRGVCGCLQDGALVNGSEVVVSDGVAGAVAPRAVTVADEPILGVSHSNTATGDIGVCYFTNM